MPVKRSGFNGSVPYDINLLSGGQRIRKVDFAPLGWLCVFLLIPLNLVGVYSWHMTRQDNIQRDMEMRSLLEVQAPSAESIEALTTRIGIINEIINGRTFSWTGMLNALEPLVPGRIRLTGVRMGEGLKGLMTANAKGMEDALEFIGNLNSSPSFIDPFIQSQRPLQSGEYGLIITFRYLPEKTEKNEKEEQNRSDSR